MEDVLTTVRVKSEPLSPPGATSAVLILIYPNGPGFGSRFVLGEQPVLIGRDEECDIRLHHSSVSRHHARVEQTEQGFVVFDLRSTNGTCVNDVTVSSRPLADGDSLRVGQCLFRFLMGKNVELEYHEELHRLAIIDALTGIPNKRHLLEFLERELARSARHHRPLALVMFDIDHFKALNDSRGHLAGDHILRELAARVRAGIRADELFARYGGEEFSMVLPETTLTLGLAAAERIRELVAFRPFVHEGDSCPITISLGVAATTGEERLTAEALIRMADERLYEAKREGRNRACG